jgi:hypothetical protein
MASIGVYLRHGSSVEHDPRERFAEHPDTPERRIVAIEQELATVNRLGFEVSKRRSCPTPRSSVSTARRASKRSARGQPSVHL